MGFGGETFTSSLSSITLTRQFNNYKAGDLIAGFTSSFSPGVSWADKDSFTQLDPSKSFQILDTTDWDAATSTLNYYLPDGGWNGQTIKFFMTSDGSSIDGNVANLNIWLDGFSTMDNFSAIETQQPWYPFSLSSNYGQMRVDIPQCIWMNGRWIIDNDAWD